MTTPAAPGPSGPAATAGAGTADRVVFPPTLREVMLRPRWIGVLAFALVVAGVFAWLGQWQLARAIDTDPLPEGVTEQVRPIADVVEPGSYLSEPLVGQRVEVTGSWVPEDFLIVSSRVNDGVEGFWVTGQLRVAGTADPTSVAVAVGWAPTRADAEAAVAALNEAAGTGETVAITGRLISDEGALPPPRGEPATTMIRMSPAALLSQWHDVEGLAVYRQFVVSQSAPEGLADIIARPPAPARR